MKQILILAALISTNAFASAKLALDNDAGTATYTAHIYFFGEKATPELAKLAVDEINLYWNGGSHLDKALAPVRIAVSGKTYTVKMNATFEITTPAQAKQLAVNATPKKNFIELKHGSAAAGDRSYMTGLCANDGVWYDSDNLGNSTTAAHEFGHGLCLPHPENWDGLGQPPIMAPRGTYVEAKYQYNPAAQQGAPGGTLNPYLRKVIQFDADQLRPQAGFVGFNTAFTGATTRIE